MNRPNNGPLNKKKYYQEKIKFINLEFHQKAQQLSKVLDIDRMDHFMMELKRNIEENKIIPLENFYTNLNNQYKNFELDDISKSLKDFKNTLEELIQTLE